MGVLTVADMQSNVARSIGHVSKQESIIVRLTDRGHDAMAAYARAILVTMHVHLAIEKEMLARLEADEPPA